MRVCRGAMEPGAAFMRPRSRVDESDRDESVRCLMERADGGRVRKQMLLPVVVVEEAER